MSTFNIGDRVEVILVAGLVYTSAQPGDRGEVASHLGMAPPSSHTPPICVGDVVTVTISIGCEPAHRVMLDNGRMVWLMPRVLRKLDDFDGSKREVTGDWELCPWKPVREIA